MSTRSTSRGVAVRTESMSGLHWIGVALAAVTGVIHLWLAYAFLGDATGPAVAFLVAGVGFLVGAAAVLVDYRRRPVYALGVPFTVGQIVLWYVLNRPEFGTTGIADKVVQTLLVVVLVVLYRREG